MMKKIVSFLLILIIIFAVRDRIVMAKDEYKYTNRLIKEKSPYLLQHAHNPVDWYPWGEEAFEKAKKEDKPIFLSIGYSSCHWCHVMEEESFSDPEIAEILNKYFVPIKVDREERPDIDNIYMKAVVAMTGSGGWPLSVFLTTDKKPFYGGTYYPPEDKWGRLGFKKVLSYVIDAWKNDREKILSSGEYVASALTAETKTKDQGFPDEAIFKKAFGNLNSIFDAKYGGFGSSPKFPQADMLSFLLRYHDRTEDPRALEMVETTLGNIIKGGIHDHVGGGFHRYSTDAEWVIPHFEKMLYDQASLSGVFLEAYQVTGGKKYALAAKDIFGYVLKDMTGEEGGFYSAEDADSLDPQNPSIKEEGIFYIWEKSEIDSILDKEELQIFNEYFNVDKGVIRAQKLYDKDNISSIINKLSNVRDARPRPHLDDKILVGWNGLMISSLAIGSKVLNEDKYLKAAINAADFILQKCRREDGRLLHSYRQGKSDVSANINDYAFFIQALLDLYETSLNKKYLEEAKSLTDDMIRFFWDKAGFGFFFSANDSEELIIREKKVEDNVIPGGNSVAYLNLLRLSVLNGNKDYKEKAKKILALFSKDLTDTPTAYLHMLSAYDRYTRPGKEIKITGKKGTEQVDEILQVVYSAYLPNKTVSFVEEDETGVYICENMTCKAPVRDIAEIKKALGRK